MKTIYLQRPTVCVKVVSAKKLHIPAKLKNIHAYSQNRLELIEFNTESKIKNLPKYHNLKEKLYSKQKGVCPECHKPLDIYETSETKEHQVEIHHIVQISQGGSKTKISNLMLMHTYCHKAQHNKR
jgi:5-methylcytosine-specific restriction endonuclease McrA